MRIRFFSEDFKAGLELEDLTFIQFITENSCIYLENKHYIVKRIKRNLIRSGDSLDSELEVGLE